VTSHRDNLSNITLTVSLFEFSYFQAGERQYLHFIDPHTPYILPSPWKRVIATPHSHLLLLSHNQGSDCRHSGNATV
jgi:hypothetical protein